MRGRDRPMPSRNAPTSFLFLIPATAYAGVGVGATEKARCGTVSLLALQKTRQVVTWKSHPDPGVSVAGPTPMAAPLAKRHGCKMANRFSRIFCQPGRCARPQPPLTYPPIAALVLGGAHCAVGMIERWGDACPCRHEEGCQNRRRARRKEIRTQAPAD